jgi:hypothetical protein
MHLYRLYCGALPVAAFSARLTQHWQKARAGAGVVEDLHAALVAELR